jgi:hypothetical protein
MHRTLEASSNEVNRTCLLDRAVLEAMPLNEGRRLKDRDVFLIENPFT